MEHQSLPLRGISFYPRSIIATIMETCTAFGKMRHQGIHPAPAPLCWCHPKLCAQETNKSPKKYKIYDLAWWIIIPLEKYKKQGELPLSPSYLSFQMEWGIVALPSFFEQWSMTGNHQIPLKFSEKLFFLLDNSDCMHIMPSHQSCKK